MFVISRYGRSPSMMGSWVWLITRNTCIAEPREGLGRGKAHKMSELEGGRELDEIVKLRRAGFNTGSNIGR